MTQMRRRIWFWAGVEAILIAMALCYWYALPSRSAVEPVQVEIHGFRRMPKEGQITEFASRAELDAELGGTANYRLQSAVDFSADKLVRVGWTASAGAGRGLQYSSRFGGLLLLFHTADERYEPGCTFYVGQDAWFKVPRSATAVAATRADVFHKDVSACTALTALAAIVLMGVRRRLKRVDGEVDRPAEAHSAVAISPAPAGCC